MSSTRSTGIGKGELLPSLRGDLKKVANDLLVVCPWIDEYFASQLCKAAIADTLRGRFLVRPEHAMDAGVWKHVAGALAVFAEHCKTFEARTLDRLHAKVVLLDSKIAYVGSFNFYRFSLEQSNEIALRVDADSTHGLASELQRLWDLGTPTAVEASSETVADGMDDEVLDPIAQEILDKNPGAWVVGPKKKRRP